MRIYESGLDQTGLDWLSTVLGVYILGFGIWYLELCFLGWSGLGYTRLGIYIPGVYNSEGLQFRANDSGSGAVLMRLHWIRLHSMGIYKLEVCSSGVYSFGPPLFGTRQSRVYCSRTRLGVYSLRLLIEF